jgi:hypothetical protein
MTLSTIDSSIPSTTALGAENPPPVSITDEPPFLAVETPIIERIQTITVYTTLGINDIAAYSPTAPQVISGSTWYVPGDVITVPPAPVITSTFSGNGAVITPGGGGGGAGPFYPFTNSTSSVGTGTGAGTGVGTGTYVTKIGGTGTGVGTSSSFVSGGTSASASAGAGPYRPRPGRYGTVVEERDVVKRSGAASVRATAGLFVLALFAVLVVL